LPDQEADPEYQKQFTSKKSIRGAGVAGADSGPRVGGQGGNLGAGDY